MANSLWKQAEFTVPTSVSNERVQFVGDKYRVKYGNLLESQGWLVLQMTKPTPVKPTQWQAPDRRRYVIQALITKKPTTLTYDIPDKYVGTMMHQGFKLKE